MLPKSLKAVFIDLDGTMVDSAPELSRAINQMLTQLLLPTLPIKKIKTFIGHGVDFLICNSIKEATKNNNEIFFKASDYFHNAYIEHAHKSKVYEGVETILSLLRDKKYSLACITNKPKIFTEKILQSKKLDLYFDLIISGDTLPNKKPSPDQLLYACGVLNIKPIDAVMIGDSMADIQAARSAGTYFIGVTYGYTHGEKLDFNLLDGEANSFSDISKLL